ncbi:hypothetical protein [Chitinophaga sp. Cy-1792]|uniref:hypothetical protein n=1 Tax=Chitinophaga sp. Cy-1792 TaxID=2608339 RepID=UPI0014205B5E|nr:hypothetical protein [Chitinophaga sp. Cy-1792]NIG56806.1 hypothetical protein [Chitinophaga sp. Cy-1792]
MFDDDVQEGSFELGAGYFGAFGGRKQFRYESYASGGYGSGRTIVANYKTESNDLPARLLLISPYAETHF